MYFQSKRDKYKGRDKRPYNRKKGRFKAMCYYNNYSKNVGPIKEFVSNCLLDVKNIDVPAQKIFLVSVYEDQYQESGLLIAKCNIKNEIKYVKIESTESYSIVEVL